MMIMKTRNPYVLAILSLFAGRVGGAPECSPYFSDHMVIKRGMPIACL